MRKLLRKWLGIDAQDEKLTALVTELTGRRPEEVEIIVDKLVNKNANALRKLINDHGTEGQL